MQQPGAQTWNGGTQTSNVGAGHHCHPAGDGPGAREAVKTGENYSIGKIQAK